VAMSRHGRTLLLCLAAVLAMTAPARAAESQTPLDDFSAIKSCLPFNVKVYPTDDVPQLEVDAPDAVAKALTAEVADGELVLSLSADVKLDGRAVVRVAVPFGSLDAVSNTGAGLMLLDTLEEEELALTNEAAGMIVAWGVAVGSLNVTNNGLGSVFVSGSILEATLTAARGSIFLDGAEGEVSIEATNKFADTVFVIKGASDSVAITGEGTSAAKILYDMGTCEADNGNKVPALRRSLCSKENTEDLEEMVDEYEGSLFWTCSVTAEADEGCTAPIEEPTAESTGMAIGSGSPGSQESIVDAGAGDNAEGEVTMGTTESKADAGASDLDPKIPTGCGADDDGSSML